MKTGEDFHWHLCIFSKVNQKVTELQNNDGAHFNSIIVQDITYDLAVGFIYKTEKSWVQEYVNDGLKNEIYVDKGYLNLGR